MPKQLYTDLDLHTNNVRNLGPFASLLAILPLGATTTNPLVCFTPIVANQYPNGPTRNIVDLNDLVAYLFGGSVAPVAAGTYPATYKATY
jgi:hypothetical protein